MIEWAAARALAEAIECVATTVEDALEPVVDERDGESFRRF